MSDWGGSLNRFYANPVDQDRKGKRVYYLYSPFVPLRLLAIMGCCPGDGKGRNHGDAAGRFVTHIDRRCLTIGPKNVVSAGHPHGCRAEERVCITVVSNVDLLGPLGLAEADSEAVERLGRPYDGPGKSCRCGGFPLISSRPVHILMHEFACARREHFRPGARKVTLTEKELFLSKRLNVLWIEPHFDICSGRRVDDAGAANDLWMIDTDRNFPWRIWTREHAFQGDAWVNIKIKTINRWNPTSKKVQARITEALKTKSTAIGRRCDICIHRGRIIHDPVVRAAV